MVLANRIYIYIYVMANRINMVLADSTNEHVSPQMDIQQGYTRNMPEP
jgi:hypothetical protein